MGTRFAPEAMIARSSMGHTGLRFSMGYLTVHLSWGRAGFVCQQMDQSPARTNTICRQSARGAVTRLPTIQVGEVHATHLRLRWFDELEEMIQYSEAGNPPRD